MGFGKTSSVLVMGVLLAVLFATSQAVGYYGHLESMQPRHARWQKAVFAHNENFDPYVAKADPVYLQRLVNLLSEVGRRK